MPVCPALPGCQGLQGDEGLAQQGVFPERTLPQHPQVDHPLLQVPARDTVIHQHLVVGGVAGASRSLGLPLSGFLGVWEEVQLDVGVRVCPILQGLQASYVHDHDEELVTLIGDGELDLSYHFA